jgi:hypothetical protein
MYQKWHIWGWASPPSTELPSMHTLSAYCKNRIA